MELYAGQEVVVREDLAEFDHNEWPTIIPAMIEQAGQIFTIRSIGTYYVALTGNGCKWLSKWLRPLNEEEEIDEPNIEFIL